MARVKVDPNAYTDLLNRVQALEKRCSKLRFGIAAGILPTVLLLLMGFQIVPSTNQIIEAQGIRLHNGLGRVVAELASKPDGQVGLWLQDGLGTTRYELHLHANGTPDMNFRDSGGGLRTFVGLDGNDVPLLALFRDASTCLGFTCNQIKLGYFGQELERLKPGLMMRTKGYERFYAEASETGSSISLQKAPPQGIGWGEVAIAAEDSGSGTIKLYDSNSKLLFQAPR
jgi:hypothetical protein